MKLKKLVVAIATVSMLAFGAQSVFANTNIYEQNDTQNNSYYNPEPFLAGAPSGYINPYGISKLGTLSSTNDNDWYLLEFPSYTYFPGATATISLIMPYGGNVYAMSIATEDGGYVQKEWLIDDSTLSQARITLEPNTKYKLHVYTFEDSVSPYNYQLAVN